MTIAEELEAAYAELRKQRPAITAVFDRDVWERAAKHRPTAKQPGLDHAAELILRNAEKGRAQQSGGRHSHHGGCV